MKKRIIQPLGLMLCAATLFMAGTTASASVILQGNPYVPTGADFRLFGLQGIDASNPLGQSGFQTQVNTNFEFTPSIGVSYDTGGGHLTDFGLGLYLNAQNQLQSTGLLTSYNTLVQASSINITVMDFDITGAAAFNFSKKVAPTITLLGANNSIVAIFNPAAIRPVMVEQTAGGAKDIWNINFATLLSQSHIADSQITGFLLSADMSNGEGHSDPYLLLSVGNGIPVPEPSNYAVGIAALAFAGMFHLRQLRLRQKVKA